MARIYDSRKAVHKVVSSQEVESLSRQGWYIVEIRQQDRIENVSEQVALPTNNGYPTQFNNSRSVVVSEPKFVMAQDGSSVLLETSAKLSAAEFKTRDLQLALSDLATKVTAMEKKTAELTASLQRSEESVTSSRENYYAERKLKAKMEEDIAKIRNAIGELKMKEILAS